VLLRYLSDRISWIVFYLLSLLLVDTLILLDDGIAIQRESLFYLNILLVVAKIVFLIWRYRVETTSSRTMEKLAQEIEEDWFTALPPAHFYQDKYTEQLLLAVDEWHRGKLSDLLAASSLEQEYMTAWVHEVKTPLTAMKLILDANRSNPIIRDLESEWLRIHLLIDQQLYISRLPMLEKDFVLEKTALQQLAALEVRELAYWCMKKNIAVEFDGEEAFVATDRKWCRFVIRQLLTNAVKYSPEGAVILLETTTTADGFICLTIKDEGPGIAAHDLPRIFDKGFTGDNGRLHNAATGLGLYLAKTVASKIGIHLTVRSVLEQGTVIDISFTTRNTFEQIQS